VPRAAATTALPLLGLMLSPARPAAAQAPSPPSAPSPSAAPNPDLDRRVRELEETVRTLQDEIRRLRGDKPADPTAPTTPAPPARPAASAGADGFAIQSPDGDFRLRLRGLIHSDLRLFAGKNGDTGTSTFFMRRVRPIFEGTLYRNIDFRLMPDFGEGRTTLQDAYIDLRFRPEASLRFGKARVPLSLERLQSSADIQFVERSIANNLAPIRDVGVQVFGDVANGTVNYVLGIYNGVPDGTSGDADTNDDKDVVARVFAQPFLNRAGSPLQGLGVGVAVTHGRQTEPLSGVTFRTGARSPFFRYDPATAADGDHTRFAPQFFFYSGPFGLLGEYISSEQRVRQAQTVETLTHNAFTLQASYLLSGEAASYRSPVPRRPYDPATGGAGAFEIAARYARFRADGDTFRLGLANPATAAEEVDAYTFGLNWYLNRSVRAQFNYERTDFGRDLQFGPDTRDHEDVVLTRLQIGF
jgi:phosphate-selective porin OprO/OprP